MFGLMDRYGNAWTHELRLRLPPQAKYVRLYAALLEELDTLGETRWLAVSHDGAAVDIGRSLRINLTPTSMVLLSYRETLAASAEPILAALENVFDPPVVRITTRSQHLVPLDIDYSLAKARAARAWLGEVASLGGQVDCAVLLDGVPPGSDAQFQVEYGVVEGPEVSDRLLRTVGRAANEPDARRPPAHDQYPEVAVFADFTWRVQRPIASLLGSDGCLARATSALDYACEFVTARAAEVARSSEGES